MFTFFYNLMEYISEFTENPKTIEQIVRSIRKHGNYNGFAKEFIELSLRTPNGGFKQSQCRENLNKNRYKDILCYDHSRVILTKEITDATSDYINANFVDGYKYKKAYIATQGPLPETFNDFWRMIWEQHCFVIVMLTQIMERGRSKCDQYWEVNVNGIAQYGNFRIKTMHIDLEDDYTITLLEITNTKINETRKISHLQFKSWPDYDVSKSATTLLNFMKKVHEKQTEMLLHYEFGDNWDGHSNGPPIVVHCSAGIGRTGTFITIDICIARLNDVNTVDVQSTLAKIRSQRAFSIQTPGQYIFCYVALFEHAVSQGKLKSEDLDYLNNFKFDCK